MKLIKCGTKSCTYICCEAENQYNPGSADVAVVTQTPDHEPLTADKLI